MTTHRITPADQARNPYFYIPVDVPAGTTRIDVQLAYPKADDCVIDLGMFDPRMAAFPTREGFRGWSGGARDRFFIATDDATPGYVHGEILPGAWHVILGLYKIPETGCDVTVTVSFDATPRALAPQPVRTTPVRPGAGWYKGDLHCHTFHSDARGAPELLHAAARQAGLDFLAVADHNTTTQRRYFHPASSPDLVFVRGMEITTAIGHANVFGMDDWVDFRMTHQADPHRIADIVRAGGGLLSVNHDKPTIPWDYELPRIDCMEVWQSHWLAWNWISLERYQRRLADGLRLSAIGGSDYHQPDRLEPEGPFVLARPTTVLWLEELSEDAVLEAMRAGRGFVTESPTGPHLSLTLDGAPMGASIVATGVMKARINVHGAKGDQLVLIDASGVRAEIHIDAEAFEVEQRFTTLDKFLRAEVVAVANRHLLVQEFVNACNGALPWDLSDEIIAAHPQRRALSNPIYVSE